jgi:preprotein translocase subunit SecG
MLYILLTLVHVIVCVFLIVVVLLQSGKAADLAGAFGGMGSQTTFGPRGSATLLSRATTASAIVFMITSMALSVVATRAGGTAKTVLDSSSGKASTAPAKPAPKPNGQSFPLNVPQSVPQMPGPGGTKIPATPVPVPPIPTHPAQVPAQPKK